jgi:hypothetical protein
MVTVLTEMTFADSKTLEVACSDFITLILTSLLDRYVPGNMSNKSSNPLNGYPKSTCMKFFRPHFKIGTMAGRQDRLFSKIGGIPWGFPKERWPSCCGRPQKLLAQLCHEPPKLDLGSPKAVLHLFQCLECLGIGDNGRAVVLLNQSDLGQGLVGVEVRGHKPELGNSQIGELWLDRWEELDDGIPSSRFDEFFDEESMWKLQDEFPQIDWFSGRERTKFGGTPRWTGNGPAFSTVPAPFEFLFQLDNRLFLNGLPPKPNEAGCVVVTNTPKPAGGYSQVYVRPDAGGTRENAPWIVIYDHGSDHYYLEFTNFGSDGTAYVYIDRTRQPHEIRWLWSR